MDASAPATSATARTDHLEALWRPEQPRGGQGHQQKIKSLFKALTILRP